MLSSLTRMALHLTLAPAAAAATVATAAASTASLHPASHRLQGVIFDLDGTLRCVQTGASQLSLHLSDGHPLHLTLLFLIPSFLFFFSPFPFPLPPPSPL